MTDPAVRILYIDDDVAMARLVQRKLERRGYAVECAKDGQEGLARLQQGGIMAVGLDHEMPGATGLDILPALLSRENAPPVVYVTGAGDTRVAVAALKAGADDYVPKEVGEGFFDLLVAAIDQALERAQLRRERERAEQEVRIARDRAEMLLREVNHRVANSLALVAAFVQMQKSGLSDTRARAALEETQARITAIAGIHRSLYTSGDVRSVRIDAYLKTLLTEMRAAIASDRPDPFVIVADAVPVPTDKAISLAVIVTELVTNACKYAYPQGQAGSIRVSAIAAGGHLSVSVEDDGVGFSETDAPQGTGLGTRIIQAMATSLGALLQHDRQHAGTRVTLTMPLQAP
ncbi:response regulator [Azospirillum picis]|uniref:histidine kinase n=1 Tax=Azospirillum picis TaxID=488438 RepID=A0ABU0MV27_9PROT|nr:response regulator [Azospirillum picis]MBP2303398.1 two-component sensor histidine kinase/CheY-like chemotaxis protein [Azospirillum picis]MDQ0537276.1 two-component sensor histidine kinase/CheY-like chemotaxis protein [Azospirillum picis]